MLQSVNFTRIINSITQSFENGTINNNNSTISANQTQNSTTNNLAGGIVTYINYLSTLNRTQCPTNYSAQSTKTCFCETLYSTLEKLPRTVQLIWNQLKPIFIGKLLYAPNNTLNNALVKKINSTFAFIDSILQLIEQIDSATNNVDSLTTILEMIRNLLPPNLQEQFKYETVLETIKNSKSSLVAIKNLIKCFELNKFVGYEFEYQAVDDGMKLIEADSLWAVLIFDNDINQKNVTTATNSTTISYEIPKKFSYKIRMATDLTHNTFYTQDRYFRYGPNICITCNIDFLYGYIYLQDMIEKAVIELKTNQPQNIGIVTQMNPYPCFINDKFVNAITRTLPLFMVLAWIFTVSMMVKDIVYEKEKRLKEFMRVMGLTNAIHWTAWFITAFISMIIICLLLVIILKFGKILTYSDFGVLIVFFCCFTISVITQCFLISVFFGRANLAAAVGGKKTIIIIELVNY